MMAGALVSQISLGGSRRGQIQRVGFLSEEDGSEQIKFSEINP